jgi:uncharacterized Ntn-hydrolase superfamily protein
VIAGLAPGHGAIAAQAFTNPAGRDEGAARLAEGTSPQEIVRELASSDFDWLGLPFYRLRQYGVVSLDEPTALAGAPASYTGPWTLDWHGQRHGRDVSVQGNTLYGPEVVDGAFDAYAASAARCPLADRLLLALEAGAAQGGDRRCSRQQAALSAFVIVAKPGDEAAPWMRLVVDHLAKGGANPVALLRREFDDWQTQHRAEAEGCTAR